MTSPEEFLADLDHVVADYETSDDAMRWMPEPPPLRPVDTWAGVLGDVGGLGHLIGERLAVALQNERALHLYQRAAQTDPWPEVGHVTVEWRNNWDPEPWIDPEVWAAANPAMVGARRMVATSTTRQGASPTRMVMDELAAFMGRAVEPLRRAHQEIESFERRLATTDPDKPGRVVTLRHGVVAQQSPYGPKPRSRDGQVQGGHARRARVSPGRRGARRARAHLGDEARP